MSRPRIDVAARLIAAAAALGAVLGGCSSIYTDRRETITSSAGDAIAANEAQQTVDPWPRQSGNPNIAFNGQRMQAAMERYRLDKVTTASDPEAAQSTQQTQNVTEVSVGNGSTTNSSSSGTTTTTTTSGQ